MERLSRHFLLFILLGIVCYTGLVLFAQGGKFRVALLNFPLRYLPLLLFLALLNFLLRYLRWHIYLNASNIKPGVWKSFRIFMAGLTMTVTPGKAGEALKAHLLKKEGGSPWSMGLPVVFAERLTDLIGIVILVALGLKILPIGRSIVFLGIAVCIFFLVISAHPTLFRAMINLMGKFPGLAGRSEWLLEMHRNIRRLITIRLLFVGVLISTIAWFAECMILYFVLLACQGEGSLLQASLIYALSTLAGALSFLPGGLAATEGSMVGLLLLFGLGRNQASLATLVVRVCTLWFAVFMGAAFLLSLQKSPRHKRKSMSEEKVLYKQEPMNESNYNHRRK